VRLGRERVPVSGELDSDMRVKMEPALGTFRAIIAREKSAHGHCDVGPLVSFMTSHEKMGLPDSR
jgi:hypothetical protein